MPRRLNTLVFLSCITLCSSTQAQGLFEFLDDFGKPASQQRNPWEERIETERHDFTQSAVTVGRGVLQVESGYSYFYKDAEKLESSHTGPELMLRMGLSEDIEFRLRWNYAWKFIKDEEDEIGAEDIRYSLKLQLTRPEGESLMPTTAVEIRGTAPTGGDEFSPGAAQFSLDGIYQWQLTERCTLAGSSGFATNGFGDLGITPEEAYRNEDFAMITQSAVVGLELTERNTGYVEWYGLFSTGLDEPLNLSFFDLGVDHYVTDNFVLDIRGGVGLTDDSDDVYIGVGGGYRF